MEVLAKTEAALEKANISKVEKINSLVMLEKEQYVNLEENLETIKS